MTITTARRAAKKKIQVSLATKHVYLINIVKIGELWLSTDQNVEIFLTKSREILQIKQQGVFFHEISFREKIGPARFREISQGFREK